jgi:AbrB family looped-hinge helix DNA binding protein
MGDDLSINPASSTRPVSPELDLRPAASYPMGKMKAETHLTSKGQVVIPKAVRDRMKWKTGTRLQVEATNDGVVLLRSGGREGDIDALIDQVSGCLKEFDRDPIAELEADHRTEIEADERWLRRRR